MFTEKKKIILDTDIGGDCDDAIALALINNLINAEKCSLLLVTLAINFDGGCSTVRAINEYYKNGGVPVGAGGKVRECKKRAYSEHIKKRYGFSDLPDGESVKLLRKTLSGLKEKVTVIAIGPLTNLAALLNSGADEFSSLDGESLVKERVKEFFVMGGSELDMAEYNIEEDISAAQRFFGYKEAPVHIFPWELGEGVLTGETLVYGDNPAGECVNFWCGGRSKNRDGWDPVTCACAILGDEPFEKERVSVTVTDSGKTIFDKDENGNCFLYKSKVDKRLLKEYLERYLK